MSIACEARTRGKQGFKAHIVDSSLQSVIVPYMDHPFYECNLCSHWSFHDKWCLWDTRMLMSPSPWISLCRIFFNFARSTRYRRCTMLLDTDLSRQMLMQDTQATQAPSSPVQIRHSWMGLSDDVPNSCFNIQFVQTRESSCGEFNPPLLRPLTSAYPDPNNLCALNLKMTHTEYPWVLSLWSKRIWLLSNTVNSKYKRHCSID